MADVFEPLDGELISRYRPLELGREHVTDCDDAAFSFKGQCACTGRKVIVKELKQVLIEVGIGR